MLFLSIWSSIVSAWRTILLAICEAIYFFITKIYEIFEVVGTAQLLNDGTIQKLYNRIGLLLGIYMLFKLCFSFIHMLINPDLISDKEKGVGNIAKKAILVVLLLGAFPTIFTKAFEIQNLLVGANSSNTNVLQRLVLPSKISSSSAQFGNLLSAYLFTGFYKYDDEYQIGDKDRDCFLLNDVETNTYTGEMNNTYLYEVVSRTGRLDSAYQCIETMFYKKNKSTSNSTSDNAYVINFNIMGILAIIFGAVVLWILINYTINVGVRVVQLAFLRMISPIAIMSYLSPKKDTTFEKWGKMFITTYIDLFIRMAIIYFVVYVIAIITSDEGLILTKSYNAEWIIKIIIVVALMFFAKKAPELLKELFPKGGAASIGFGVKSPKNFVKELGELPGAGLAKRAYGAASVGMRTGWKNMRNRFGEAYEDRGNNNTARNIRRIFTSGMRGLGGGVFRGFGTTDKSGRKSAYTKGSSMADELYVRRDAGYTSADEFGDKFRGAFNMKTVAKRQADTLSMVQEAAERNKMNLTDTFNNTHIAGITNAAKRTKALELASFRFDSGTSKYVGILDGKYQEFDDTAYSNEVATNGGNTAAYKNHVQNMTAITKSSKKANKQQDALNHAAQKASDGKDKK